MNCEKCKVRMSYDTNSIRREVGETALTAVVGIWICGECMNVVTSVQVRDSLSQAVVLALCELPVDPGSLRTLRTWLELSQDEFGTIVGVSGETISRWEHGHTPINRAAWSLIGVMVRARAGVDRLEFGEMLERFSKEPDPPHVIDLGVFGDQASEPKTWDPDNHLEGAI